jgi:hypothetical protein
MLNCITYLSVTNIFELIQNLHYAHIILTIFTQARDLGYADVTPDGRLIGR